MPDNNEQNVLFGAEFDSSKTESGVNKIIEKLVQLKDTEDDLKKSLQEYNEQIQVNDERIDNNAKKMDGLKRTIKENEKSYAALLTQVKQYEKESNPAKVDELRGKMSLLTKEHQNAVKGYSDLKKAQDGYTQSNSILATNITKSKESLIGLASQIHEVKKAQTEAESINLESRRSWERLTSAQYLTGEGLNHLRREIVHTGLDFATGFAGGLVALVIPTLIELGKHLFETEKKFKELATSSDFANAIFGEADKKVGPDLIKLEAIRAKLNDTNISQAERIKLANEYNKTADEGNKIDTDQINNLEKVNAAIERQIALLLQRALTQAAINKITEEANKYIDKEVKLQEEFNRRGIKNIDDYEARVKKQQEDDIKRFKADPQKAFRDQQIAQLDQTRKRLDGVVSPAQKAANAYRLAEERFAGLVNAVKTGRKELEELVRNLQGFITIEGLTTEKGPKVENVFKEKLAELKAKLADVTQGEFQSDTLIKKKFEEQLNKEYAEIAKLLKEKKLTGPQSDILKGLLDQINAVELTKGLDEFHKKQRDAMRAVSDAILDAQIEDGKARVNNIHSEFLKQGAQIEQSYEATVEQLGKKLAGLIITIDDNVKHGLLSKEQGAASKQLLTSIFGDLIDQAGIARTQAQLELSFKAFQRVIENIKIEFGRDATVLSEATTKKIQDLSTRYLQGSISYSNYQKKLTKILQDEANQRRKIDIQEQEDELRRVNARLAGTTDEAQKRQLEAQQKTLLDSLSKLRREDATAQAQQDEEELKRQLDKFIGYVKAVQEIGNAIINFWSQVNQAEAAQLDRSIALQERRVANAQIIADRGNAQYLKQEKQREDQLIKNREDNARRQLAINNALTLSNATVAAITAIAQAVQTGDPFAAIAAVAAVIGAIAAAYSFVNSLQQPVAQFYEGSENVSDAGRPAGRDKVPAMLHKGERVVTAEDNKKYWDALHGIHSHKIPPDVINEFVANYPYSSMPMVDFSRLAGATKSGLGADQYELLTEVGKLNGTMRQVYAAISDLGVHVNMDENGFSASISKHLKSERLRRRS